MSSCRAYLASSLFTLFRITGAFRLQTTAPRSCLVQCIGCASFPNRNLLVKQELLVHLLGHMLILGKHECISRSSAWLRNDHLIGCHRGCLVGIWGSYCLLYTSPSPRDGLLSRMPS